MPPLFRGSRSRLGRRSSASNQLGRALLPLLLCTLFAGACTDIRDYAGLWNGPIVAESAVRQGFDAQARVGPLRLENVSLVGVTATLTTSDGRFDGTRLRPITKAAADDLADISLGAGSLRTFMAYALLANETASAPALLVLSLFDNERVQLRVLRGNDLYGIFHLSRP